MVVEAVMSEQVCDQVPFGGVRVNKIIRNRQLPDLPDELGTPTYWVRRFEGGVFVVGVNAGGLELTVSGRYHERDGYTLHTMWLSDYGNHPHAPVLADWAAEMCMRAIDGCDQVVSVAHQVLGDWRTGQQDAA